MARGGSQSGVKSHRRGRRRQQIRRRLPVAPWIVYTTVLALFASGIVAVYAMVLGAGCSGDPVKAVVAAPDEIKNTLQTAARKWADTEPDVNGDCIGVEVKQQSSADMVTALSAGTEGSGEGMPHIWVPESTAWLNMAKISDRGKEIIPKTPPLVATSPTVIAMPTPAAEALGWQANGKPKKAAGKPTWSNLVKLAQDSDWSQFGKDDWGDIKIGMSDPMSSTADLHALLSMVNKDNDKNVESEELANVSTLRGSVAEEASSVSAILDEMSSGKEGDPVKYLSAFPALERDVLKYNTLSNHDVPLTAVYPADGSLDADHPFAVLQDVSWTNKTYQNIGNQFADYLTGEGGFVVKDEGFRDGTRREGDKKLANTEGLSARIEEPQLDAAYPDSLQTTLAAWQAVARPANILVVVDSSESMSNEEVYGSKRMSRIDIIRKSLQSSLTLLGEQANVGLWRYPNVPGGQSYEQLASIEKYDQGQKDNIESSLDNVTLGNDGGLNDTVVSAYEAILSNYNDEKGAANLVVVVSDGGDESGGLKSTKDATDELKDMAAKNRDKNASVMTIGYGSDVDKGQLGDFASATEGRFHSAKWSDEINVQLLNALYYD